jgi:hypothetical protein
MRTYRDQGALEDSKAQITQGADRKGADRTSVPTRRIENDGPGLVTTQPGFGARHDQLTPRPPAIIIAQQIKVMAVVRYRAGCAIDKFATVKQNRAARRRAFCVHQKKRNLAPDATSVHREA